MDSATISTHVIGTRTYEKGGQVSYIYEHRRRGVVVFRAQSTTDLPNDIPVGVPGFVRRGLTSISYRDSVYDHNVDGRWRWVTRHGYAGDGRNHSVTRDNVYWVRERRETKLLLSLTITNKETFCLNEPDVWVRTTHVGPPRRVTDTTWESFVTEADKPVLWVKCDTEFKRHGTLGFRVDSVLTYSPVPLPGFMATVGTEMNLANAANNGDHFQTHWAPGEHTTVYLGGLYENDAGYVIGAPHKTVLSTVRGVSVSDGGGCRGREMTTAYLLTDMSTKKGCCDDLPPALAAERERRGELKRALAEACFHPDRVMRMESVYGEDWMDSHD